MERWGWGEAITMFPDAAKATKMVVEDGYAPLLVGESVLDVERLWHAMLARVWWYGPQGIAAFGISAVDMALWDLKGQALGQPVCTLLGSKLHDRVSAMASIHLDMENLDWTVEEFQWFREQGYRIVKGGWGKRPEAVFGLDRNRDLELAERVRGVIGGGDRTGLRCPWSTGKVGFADGDSAL